MDNQQQANEELHQMTIQALWDALMNQATEDEIRLLCWHAGVPFETLQTYVKGEL